MLESTCVEVDHVADVLTEDNRASNVFFIMDCCRSLASQLTRAPDLGTHSEEEEDSGTDEDVSDQLTRGGGGHMRLYKATGRKGFFMACDPRKTAFDGPANERNGVFTKHLISTLRSDSRISVEQLRATTTNGVVMETDGKQSPIATINFVTTVYFEACFPTTSFDPALQGRRWFLQRAPPHPPDVATHPRAPHHPPRHRGMVQHATPTLRTARATGVPPRSCESDIICASSPRRKSVLSVHPSTSVWSFSMMYP